MKDAVALNKVKAVPVAYKVKINGIVVLVNIIVAAASLNKIRCFKFL